MGQHKVSMKRPAFALLAAAILILAANGFAAKSPQENSKDTLVDFELPDLDGKKRKLSEFRGKWVVVNYWATWCPPCLKEIPELVDFHDAHKDKDAVVLGVNFEQIGREELVEFMESYFVSYPVVQMQPAPSSPLGAIPGLPTTFLVSPKGELVARQTGPVTMKMIEDFISGESLGDSQAAKQD